MPSFVHNTVDNPIFPNEGKKFTGSIDLATIGLHLHDRGGHAMANAMRGYELGVRTFDAAVGGIGGNRASADYVGNIATEALCKRFDEMGVETGIDRAALRDALEIVRRVCDLAGDPSPPLE